MKKVELSVYFSLSEKNREPTKENCDKVVESPSGSINLPILGKDKFENEEVYLSLFSITGCIVNLSVSFPDLKIQNFYRKTVKEDQLEDTDFENFLVCKKWRAHNRTRAAEKDYFIKEHVDKVKDFSAWRMRRQ